MRGAVHRVAILLAWLGLGCATTVDIAFDEREDFSRYRTWDWLPHGLPNVDAPESDARSLDAHLARLIERELLERGFERSADRPDFLVTYRLALRRRAVIVDEPAAPYLLSSLHHSPSYWVEGSRKALRVHEKVRLSIGVSEAGEWTMIWRATLLRTLEDAPVLRLDDAVATLLDRFPPLGPPKADRAPGRGS
jgi:hypothetical protein